MKHLSIVFVLAVATGCLGELGADAPFRGNAGSPCEGAACADTDPPAPPGCQGDECRPATCEGICIEGSRLTRLTRAEYTNTVYDVLGVEVEPGYLPPDQLLFDTFASNESSELTVDDVDRYMAMAETVADEVPIGDMLACDGRPQAECADAFIRHWGRRLHRRPLSDEEVTGYEGLRAWAAGEEYGFWRQMRTVLGAMLQSPSFLFRIERVQDGEDPTTLDGFAVASRLSYFLWRSAPDAALLDAAAAGELDAPDGVEIQARRLLEDARADEMIREFHRSWLGIAELSTLTRTDEALTPELGAAMQEQTELFAVRVFREHDGSLRELLGAQTAAVDATLASFYEVDAPAMGWEDRALPGRRGVLTHASVMAANAADSEADTIYRGKFVRLRLLCQTLAPRPDGIDDTVMELAPTLGEDLDERERLEALTEGDDCIGCHSVMNPPGFAFTAYDSIGRLREMDRTGRPVRPDVEITGAGSYASDLNGSYANAVELAAAASESADVAQCMTAQWMRFALGRDVAGEATSFVEAYETFESSDRDLRELVVAITRTDAFRYRAPRAE